MLIRRKFAELFAAKTAEVHKDALHYINQPFRWSYKEVNRHSQAYARGLLEMGLKPGDTVSTWITCSESAESNILHLACYHAGLKLMPFSSGQDLPESLSISSALIFSPWEKFNTEYRIDHILSSLPQLLSTPSGSLVSSPHKTKYFIQTGFRTIRGTNKLKTIPVYNGNNIANNGFEILYKGKNIKNEEFEAFIERFSKDLGKVVVNSLPSKSPLAIGALVGTLKAGNKMVSAVLSDPGEAVNLSEASVLVTSEEQLGMVKQGCSVNKLVLALEDVKDIDRVAKLFEKKGVRANSVLAYNSADLSNLV